MLTDNFVHLINFENFHINNMIKNTFLRENILNFFKFSEKFESLLLIISASRNREQQKKANFSTILFTRKHLKFFQIFGKV